MPQNLFYIVSLPKLLFNTQQAPSPLSEAVVSLYYLNPAEQS